MSPSGQSESSPRSPAQSRDDRADSDGRNRDRALRDRGRFVAIGNFDGVHKGHQSVLLRAGREAVRMGLIPSVLTFDPHPTEVLTGKRPASLTTLSRKVRLLKSVVPGLAVCVEPFTRDLAGLEPAAFCRQILSQKLRARVVLVGQNFRFGRGRSGDLTTLEGLGVQLGFDVRVEELMGDESGSFSSTRVRQLLVEGDVEQASRILGRPHLISGIVERGDQRGRALGFPTANLGGIEQVVPQDGVYAVHVYDADAEGVCLGPGVANLGARPTVDRPPAHEVHLIGKEMDLYGRNLALAILVRLRAQTRFASIHQLRAQIEEDVGRAAEICKKMPPPRVPTWW